MLTPGLAELDRRWIDEAKVVTCSRGPIVKLLFSLAAAWALSILAGSPAEAQVERVWRIGWLQPVALPPSYVDAVLQGLRDLGYVEGKNLRIDYRWAEGKSERLPALADELACRARAIALVRRAEATIHGEQMPRHVVRRARREKHRRAGNFGRLAPAPCRRAPLDPGRELGVGSQCRVHLGAKEAR